MEPQIVEDVGIEPHIAKEGMAGRVDAAVGLRVGRLRPQGMDRETREDKEVGKEGITGVRNVDSGMRGHRPRGADHGEGIRIFSLRWKCFSRR